MSLMQLMLPLWIMAQADVSGKVIDAEENEPLVGVSVIIKDSCGKIIKFATTKTDGSFFMQGPMIEGSILEAMMMGYAKQSMPIDSLAFPLTITMKSEAIRLKEVSVKADRIREQGDTITYYVASFSQSQDRSIGDVLRRMPGIDVAKNGKIQYQGEDINKFYIEGADLLGGKYGVATNGINYEDIGAIEVLENHQPMQVLSGISFSSKAAVNLKLKDRAKASWNIHGKAGGGWSWQPEGALWNGEFFAMAAKSSYQGINTIKTNNSGEDLAVSNTDFFAGSRGTALDDYVSIGLPNVPSLNDNRTFFNRSVWASTNNLWQLRQGELKFNMDYLFNHVTADASNITTYFLNEGNRVITESRSGTEHEHSVNGQLTYELNNRTTFLNNTLQTHIDWDEISLNTTGTIPNIQSAEIPDYYISNRFKMIRRFKDKHLITFESRSEWESLPQALNLNVNGAKYFQSVGDKAFFTHENVAYAFNFRGVTVSVEGGLKGYWRSMNSQLSGLPEELPGITENLVNTNSLTAYAKPKFEYWVKDVNITLDLPVSYAHHSFDKAIANKDEAYFSPSLGLNWKPNNRFSAALRGGHGRSPMNLNLIHSGLIMTNYRTLESGVENFYNSSSQNLSASFTYKQTHRGLFANGLLMHSWNQMPYTMSQQLYDNYVIYSYADAKNDSKMLLAMGSLSKTLNFMNGTFSLNGSYTQNTSNIISQQESINSVSDSWGIGGKINGSPCRWFSFDYAIEYHNSRISMNDASVPWLSTLTNSLSLNFVPHDKWQIQINGENYSNELTEDAFKNMLMIDTKLAFLATKQIELSATLMNILNERQYNYTTYTQLSSFESQRMLRGRQLLFSITLRK